MIQEKGIKSKLSEEEKVTLDFIVYSSMYNEKNGCSKNAIKAGQEIREKYFDSILSSETLNHKIIKPLRDLSRLIKNNEGLPISLNSDSTIKETISAIYHNETPEEIKTAYEKVRENLERLNGMDKDFFKYP